MLATAENLPSRLLLIERLLLHPWTGRFVKGGEAVFCLIRAKLDTNVLVYEAGLGVLCRVLTGQVGLSIADMQ